MIHFITYRKESNLQFATSSYGLFTLIEVTRLKALYY